MLLALALRGWAGIKLTASSVAFSSSLLPETAKLRLRQQDRGPWESSLDRELVITEQEMH